MSKYLIELENVSKNYLLPKTKLFSPAKKLRALKSTSLKISAGETLGIIGESGCGKTTLGKIIKNFLTTDSGSIKINGRDISTYIADKKYETVVQYIFQDPLSSLCPSRKTGAVLDDVLKHFTLLNEKERTDKIYAMLEHVGLKKIYYNYYPHELSGGQCQRIAIIAALLTRAKILICDEVVSSLDVSIQAQILNLLKALQKEFRLTILFISHDLNVVHYMSDRIAVMYLGCIVELGSAESISLRPRHPYTRLLESSLPDIKHKIEIKDEQIPSLSQEKPGCPFEPRCLSRMPVCRQSVPPLVCEDGVQVRCFLYSREKIRR